MKMNRQKKKKRAFFWLFKDFIIHVCKPAAFLFGKQSHYVTSSFTIEKHSI